MHNFHSSTSEKRKRKSGEIRGKFPLSHAGEREKISQEKRQNLSGEIKKNPFLFIRFALSLLLLFLHSSHCLPLTEKQGFRSKSWPHSLSFSQPGIFSPLPVREPFTASEEGKRLPHELILKSVKVQREMVLEEKRIRSVFLLPSTSKKKRKSPRLRGRKSQDRGEKISLRK